MSTPPRPLPPKKDVALALLQGPSLYIHLDPRKAEVVVPAYFKKQPQLVLQVGLNMAIAIPDLKVDDEGVTCTLSFNRRPFWCRLPWTAVYALVGEDMKGMIWPDEVPAEVAAQRDPKGAPAGPAATPARAKPQAKKKLATARSAAEAGDASSRSDAASVAPARPNVTENSDSGEARPAAREAGQVRRTLAPVQVESSPRGAPPSPRGTDAGKSGKRELPPYLRVVK